MVLGRIGAFLRTCVGEMPPALPPGPGLGVVGPLGLGGMLKGSLTNRCLVQRPPAQFARPFIHSRIRAALTAGGAVRGVRIEGLVTQSCGLAFQELTVWWGDRYREEREKLFYCSGRGTHLVLSFSSRG